MEEIHQAVPRATIEDVDVWCRFDELAPVGALMPHPQNANKHPKTQIERLALIIAHQGWRNCITVSNRSGFITKGHGRLAAAKKLGLTMVPVERQDYPDEASEIADLLADNRIAELAEIDKELLQVNLETLDLADFDIQLAGFDVRDVRLDGVENKKKSETIGEIQYQVIVRCRDEREQIEIMRNLEERGLSCQPLIL